MSAPRRVRLGMITPSSNTALEPATAAMLAGTPEITAHFARLRVTEIGLGGSSDAQFDFEPMLAAAELLADARCDAICWNGTSGAWLGIERDRALCEAIRARTGIPATTAVLALLEAFARLGVKRYALVTPYLDEVQQAIVARFAGEGLECVAERHAGLRTNFDFAAVPYDRTAAMVREVSTARPDAVAIVCTNVDGSRLAPALERELGIVVLDSIAVALWGALRAAGVSTAALKTRGALFDRAQ